MHELFGKPFLSRPHGVRWVLHDGRVHWTVIDGHPRPRVTIGSVGSGSKHLALVCSFGTLVAASPAVPNLMLDEFRTPEHIQIASPGSGVLPGNREVRRHGLVPAMPQYYGPSSHAGHCPPNKRRRETHARRMTALPGTCTSRNLAMGHQSS